MKTRKATQCLFRHPSALSFPTQSLRRPHQHASLPLPKAFHPPPAGRRAFTTSPPKPLPPNDPSGAPSDAGPAPDSGTARAKEMSALISSVFNKHNNTAPAKRTRPPPKPTATSSFEDLQQAHKDMLYRPESESRSSRDGSIFGAMKMPKPQQSTDPSLPPSTQTSPSVVSPYASLQSSNFKPRAQRTITSRPSLGRTVEVGPQGVARALQVLGRECKENNVRGDQIRGRFHERNGMKRKRLRRERWRRRFGEGFRATVKLVAEMRRKGW